MRHGFEPHLHHLNVIAKDEAKPDLTDQERERLNTVLDWYIDKSAERYGTPERTQRFVYQMQQKKLEIIKKLRESLASIDNPFHETKPDARPVVCRDGHYYWQNDGQEQKVTLGELMTDGDWGIKYHLDAASVPRRVRKRYLLERAKHELMECLNQQIVENELKSKNRKGDNIGGYSGMRNWEEHASMAQSGFYAERMVRNFMQKLAYDLGGEFRIVEADAHHDVEMKIDFFIVLPALVRGVGVDKQPGDEDDKPSRLGIQFTVKRGKAVIEKKSQQIAQAKEKLGFEDRIRDIVLVRIPLKKNLGNVRSWINDGKPPGGPEKRWHANVQELMLRRILEGFLPDEKIEELCKRLLAQIPPELWEQEEVPRERKTKEVQESPRYIENVIFSLQKGKRRQFEAVDQSGKTILLTKKSARPIPGVSYKVQIVNDTSPDEPHGGEYQVKTFHHVIFEKTAGRNGSVIFKSASPTGKLIKLLKTSSLPEPGMPYMVQVAQETLPGNPERGVFMVRIVEPEKQDQAA